MTADATTELLVTNTPHLATFGARLRWLRKQRGFRRASDFARRIGKEPRTVYRYESDQKVPKEATLRRIVQELDANAVWLREGRGAPFVEGLPGVEAYLQSEEGRRLSPEVVRAVREWPYDLLGMANPSEEEVRRVTVMVEMCLDHARKLRNDRGDKGA